MGGTKQSPGEKGGGGNRNWGDLFKGFASFYFICLIYHQRYFIIISNTYCKGCLMCYLGGRKREDALDDLPTSEFLNIGQSTYLNI